MWSQFFKRQKEKKPDGREKGKEEKEKTRERRRDRPMMALAATPPLLAARLERLAVSEVGYNRGENECDESCCSSVRYHRIFFILSVFVCSCLFFLVCLFLFVSFQVKSLYSSLYMCI